MNKINFSARDENCKVANYVIDTSKFEGVDRHTLSPLNLTAAKIFDCYSNARKAATSSVLNISSSREDVRSSIADCLDLKAAENGRFVLGKYEVIVAASSVSLEGSNRMVIGLEFNYVDRPGLLFKTRILLEPHKKFDRTEFGHE